MYADKSEPKKGIFDRLEQTKARTQTEKLPPIFARLGGKKDDEDDVDMDEKVAIRFAGQLKNNNSLKKVKSNISLCVRL